MAGESQRQSFGKRFRQARKAAKLTQQQVADHLGIYKQAISLWESGTWMPRVDALLKAAKQLGVTPDALLLDEDPALGRTAGNAPAVTMLPYPTRDEIVSFAKGKIQPNSIERRWPSGLADVNDLLVVDAPDEGMGGRIPQGAQITIKYGKFPEPGEIALWVMLATGEVLLRRYRPGLRGKPAALPYVLRADHADYVERTITKEDRPLIVGTMVAAHVVGSR